MAPTSSKARRYHAHFSTASALYPHQRKVRNLSELEAPRLLPLNPWLSLLSSVRRIVIGRRSELRNSIGTGMIDRNTKLHGKQVGFSAPFICITISKYVYRRLNPHASGTCFYTALT